jgi:hypothetical protein
MCPARTYAGDTMTLEGHACEAFDGTVYDGAVVATNAITWRDIIEDPTYDSAKPMSLVFDAFTMTRSGVKLSIDGRLDQSSPEAPSYTAHSVLAVGHPVSHVTEDISTTCTAQGAVRTCEITDGFANVAALGTFEIRGATSIADGVFSGWLELVGSQTLYVDLDTVNQGCHPYTIDGVHAGSVCISAAETPLDIELGYGAGCLADVLHLEGYSDIVVDAMTIEVLGPRMETPLIVPLADPQPSPFDGWVWSAIGDTSQVSWDCDDISETDFRVTATLGDHHTCEAWGPTTSRFPAGCADE